MEVQYRQSFLKDLKSLKGTPVYQRIYDIAFTTLPNAQSIQEIANVKAMQGFTNRYRVRVGDYRIGIEISENTIEIIRTLHRGCKLNCVKSKRHTKQQFTKSKKP